MEKKLLLLGVLRGQEMHGYQLYDHLEQGVGMGVNLKKSNAYKLLGRMETDGWVTFHEEREGNRPPRRVYAITPAGEAAFQRMLRESLAEFSWPELPGTVALNFLAELPNAEAAALLRQRRVQIEQKFAQVAAFPSEVFTYHRGIANIHHFLSNEMAWLDELIDQLSTDTSSVD